MLFTVPATPKCYGLWVRPSGCKGIGDMLSAQVLLTIYWNRCCYFSWFLQLLPLCKVSQNPCGGWIKKSMRTISTGYSQTCPSLRKCCGLAKRSGSFWRKSFLFAGNKIYRAQPCTAGSGLPSSKTMENTPLFPLLKPQLQAWWGSSEPHQH